MTDRESKSIHTTNTEGGAVVGGSVNIHTGNFIGRDVRISGDNVEGDKHVHLADDRSDVHGLSNPYLGLSAYTYAQRTLYGGRRETIACAMALLTRGGEQYTLLFVNGASGSGKSSFAQAALLPAVEAHYHQQDQPTRWAVMRPSRQPLAGLAEALRHLGLTAQGSFAAVQPYMVGKPIHHAPEEQISLLVIDQFEEAFTQSVPEQRVAFFHLLANLPLFSQLRMHTIVTLQVDYLPDLFAYPGLYEIATLGIALRVMKPAEVAEAIQQPIRQRYPAGEKRMEAELVAVLAQEAAQEATYLPLLQVTCEELWRRGWLKRTAYGTLTDAIRRRAEEIYAYTSDDQGNSVPRPLAEQEQVLQLFLDLVDVSPNDEVRRDVRRRRSRLELTRGQPLRRRLIKELTTQRLLSTDREEDPETGATVETVDIIHESLIGNWDRLQQAIEAQREQLQQRARFETALQEWRNQGQIAAYLLDGVRMAEAEELNRREDVAIQHPEARLFLQQSIAQHETRRRRQRNLLLGVMGVLILLLMAALSTTWWAVNTNDELAHANKELVIKVTEVAQAQAIAVSREAEAQVVATAEANARTMADHNADAGESLFELTRGNTDRALLLARAAILGETDVYSPTIIRAVRNAFEQTTANHLLKGHAVSIYAIAVSPDGKQVATGSADHTVRIWGVNSGTLLATLDGHEDAISGLAWSPNGQKLLTGSYDHTARVWDATSGTLLAKLIGHTAPVISVTWSPNGQQILTGSADTTARIWDTASGKSLVTLAGHTGSIWDVAWSPDGQQILTGSTDTTARIWDTIGNPLVVLEGHTAIIRRIAWSPDGQRVLTGSYDGTARIWDTAGNLLTTLEGHIARIEDVAWSPNGQQVLTGSHDMTARIWDAASGKPLTTLSGHTSVILDVAWSPDGQRVLTGSRDTTARIWDATSYRQLTLLRGHVNYVRAVAWSPDSKLVFTGSSDSTVRIWEVSPTQRRFLLIGHTDTIRTVAWSPDGKKILTGSDDHTAKIWDAVSSKELISLEGHTGVVRSALWSPDGKKVLTASDDHTVKIWDARDGRLLTSLEGHANSVWAIAWSPDGQRVLTGSGDTTARIWDATSGHMIISLEGHTGTVWAVAWSPDGRQVLTGSYDNKARVWDARSGKMLYSVEDHKDNIIATAWSPNGTKLLTGSLDHTAKIWNARDGSLLTSLNAHTGAIKAIAWSSDSQRVLTASGDGTARIWNASSGEELALLGSDHSPTAEINVAVWSPNDQQVLIGSVDGTARIWDAASGHMIAVLEGHSASINAVAWSPDEQAILTGSSDGTARMWIADNRLIVAELTHRVCKLFTDNVIRSEIRTWRGCRTELEAVHEEIKVYRAYIGAEISSPVFIRATEVSTNTPVPITTTSMIGAQVKIVNTGVEGLSLRSEPNGKAQSIKRVPDGSILITIGADFTGQERVWKHVRDSEGAEGWVAADYVQLDETPAPPSALAVSEATMHDITFTWTDNSNNESGFKIYKWDGSEKFLYVTTTPANATSFTQTNIQCNYKEFYMISAFNDQGESELIGYIETKTRSCPNGQLPNQCLDAKTQVVTFYEHQQCYGMGYSVLEPGETPVLEIPYDNRFSSVLVQSGYSVLIFAGPNFTDSSRCITDSIQDFYNQKFDDQMTSMSDAVSSFKIFANATCDQVTP